MNIFKFEGARIEDPDQDTDRPSRGVEIKKLIEGECGYFLHSSWMPAGLRIQPHSHDRNELFMVLEGGCSLDDGTTLVAYDSAVIPANQPYGFTVGERGMRFAVIRNGETSLTYADDKNR